MNLLRTPTKKTHWDDFKHSFNANEDYLICDADLDVVQQQT